MRKKKHIGKFIALAHMVRIHAWWIWVHGITYSFSVVFPLCACLSFSLFSSRQNLSYRLWHLANFLFLAKLV